MKLARVKRISLMLGFAASLFTAAASAAVYQVEMIVFSHVTARNVSQEEWQFSDPPPSFSNALSLQNENANGYYQTLSPSQFVMQREQIEFNRNPEYRTLLHTGWLQPFSGGASPTIHIIGTQLPYTVNGTVRVNLNRYFNVAFNLYFSAPENALARYDNRNYFHSSSNLVYFHLHETRRMKSEELNYIDFPLFGVLIKIVPARSAA